MKQHKEEPGKGVLYMNDKRKEGTKQPHYKGGFTASRDISAGEWVKMAAWRYQTQVGDLISVAEDNFQPDPNYQKPKELSKPRESKPFNDDEIPF